MFVDWRREVTFGCGIIGKFEKPRFQEIGHYCSFKRIMWCCCGRPVKNWNKKIWGGGLRDDTQNGYRTYFIYLPVLVEWLALPGWYGCAHVRGTCQAVGWCMCACKVPNRVPCQNMICEYLAARTGVRTTRRPLSLVLYSTRIMLGINSVQFSLHQVWNI